MKTSEAKKIKNKLVKLAALPQLKAKHLRGLNTLEMSALSVLLDGGDAVIDLFVIIASKFSSDPETNKLFICEGIALGRLIKSKEFSLISKITYQVKGNTLKFKNSNKLSDNLKVFSAFQFFYESTDKADTTSSLICILSSVTYIESSRLYRKAMSIAGKRSKRKKGYSVWKEIVKKEYLARKGKNFKDFVNYLEKSGKITLDSSLPEFIRWRAMFCDSGKEIALSTIQNYLRDL